MHSRLIPHFLRDIEKEYSRLITTNGVISESYMRKLFSKFEQHEYKGIEKTINIVNTLPVVTFVIFYRHAMGYVFQVSGMFAPNVNEPIYKCTKIDPINLSTTKRKNIVRIETIIPEDEVYDYQENE